MKKLLLLSFVLFFSLTLTAQRTVSAADILDDIKAGKSVAYENVTVTGTLDMTFMNEKLPDLPKKHKWYRNGGSNAIKETIDGKISFVNCVFEDDVLAYFHDEDSKYTFTASFDNDVRFKNCEFKRNAMFKYSAFERNADFSGSKFLKESTFKYAKFDTFVSFSNTFFEEYATFKYTKFKEGVSFNNAKFEDDLNLKYTKVRGDFNVSGLEVAHDINSKYTDINGDGLSKYLLKSN